MHQWWCALTSTRLKHSWGSLAAGDRQHSDGNAETQSGQRHHGAAAAAADWRSCRCRMSSSRRTTPNVDVLTPIQGLAPPTAPLPIPWTKIPPPRHWAAHLWDAVDSAVTAVTYMGHVWCWFFTTVCIVQRCDFLVFSKTFTRME